MIKFLRPQADKFGVNREQVELEKEKEYTEATENKD